MLDLRLIRQNPDAVRTALRNRASDFDISEVLSLDEEVRKVRTEVENLRARRNEIAARIARAKREGRDTAQDVAEGARVADEIAHLEASLAESDRKLWDLLTYIPNVPHSSVPVGPDSGANLEVKRWGEVRKPRFEMKPHWEIGANLDILDMERAAKIAGSRFPMLKGQGARLERALIQFMLDVHTKEQAYTEIFPPFLVNDKSMFGTGQLPKFREDMFKIQEQELYLIPTAEVPVTNVHRDEILSTEALPTKYAAYSPCFRL